MLKIFTVYDCKTEAYFPPFYMRTRGEALRAFTSEVNNPQSNFCRFPADFTLFEIGQFDEDSGNCVMLEAKVSLGGALEFKEKANFQGTMFEKRSDDSCEQHKNAFAKDRG